MAPRHKLRGASAPAASVWARGYRRVGVRGLEATLGKLVEQGPREEALRRVHAADEGALGSASRLINRPDHRGPLEEARLPREQVTRTGGPPARRDESPELRVRSAGVAGALTSKAQ